MSEFNIRKHISAQYNQDLENARHQVLRLGGLVEQQLGHTNCHYIRR